MVYFAKWKIVAILAICLLGLVYVMPNFVDRETAEGFPSFLPNQQISLGLDLQGGSHLLLEVDLASVVRERMEAVVDSVRAALLKARIRYTGLKAGPDFVSVKIRDPEQIESARQLIGDAEPDVELSLDEDGLLLMRYSEQALKARKSAAVDQSIEIVRNRIDETGTREPTIQRQGEDRILVQLPGVDNPERIKRLLGRTAKMTFHLVNSKVLVGDRVPADSRRLPFKNEVEASGIPRQIVIKKRAVLSGENLINAAATTDSRDNQPIVTFRFDGPGGRKFGKITTENVHKPFAIVLDGKVISAPVIREPILGGSGQISGNFTVAEANDLALLLRAGALPAPLLILEERSVGPGLGADSIAAGKVASVVGLAAVIVFMVVAYGFFGLMANLALVINMLLIGAALSLLQATLTLPGIAGIVLTVGMAVDANVLIFERMREESRAGRTPIAAIDAGYARALTTIIDANLTTLIAALLLFAFGSGPVKGFAVTLAIGIVTSMFTAIMVTRLMVVTWLRKTRPSALPV